MVHKGYSSIKGDKHWAWQKRKAFAVSIDMGGDPQGQARVKATAAPPLPEFR